MAARGVSIDQEVSICCTDPNHKVPAHYGINVETTGYNCGNWSCIENFEAAAEGQISFLNLRILRTGFSLPTLWMFI